VGNGLGETTPLGGNEAKPARKKSGKSYFPADLVENLIPPREVRPSDSGHVSGSGGPESGPVDQILKLWASLNEAEQAELLVLLQPYLKR
jgi:hypothetical protein